MKSFLVTILVIFSGFAVPSSSLAQSGKVPPFRILQADKKIFKAQDLPMGKPIVIIYFSPDCEDCQKLTGQLLGRINDFKGVSFAMITYLPLEYVSQFVTKFNLSKYDNIFVGTEGDYLFVKNYYKIIQFPYVVLYNKNGDLEVKYEHNDIDLDNLLLRIKNL